MPTVRVRVNKPIPPNAIGSEVEVEVDANGTPREQNWRRRFADAKIDQCLTVLGSDHAAEAANEEQHFDD